MRRRCDGNPSPSHGGLISRRTAGRIGRPAPEQGSRQDAVDSGERTYARSCSAHALPSNSPHHLDQRSTLLLFWEVLLVRNRVLKTLTARQRAWSPRPAWAADITWNGSVSTNPADGANWNGGIAPAAADMAIIGSSPQSPDFNGQSITWGKCEPIFANNIGDTGGGGRPQSRPAPPMNSSFPRATITSRRSPSTSSPPRTSKPTARTASRSTATSPRRASKPSAARSPRSTAW